MRDDVLSHDTLLFTRHSHCEVSTFTDEFTAHLPPAVYNVLSNEYKVTCEREGKLRDLSLKSAIHSHDDTLFLLCVIPLRIQKSLLLFGHNESLFCREEVNKYILSVLGQCV